LRSWGCTVLFGALLGWLCLQVLQRVHDRYTPREGDRFSEFLSLEFYLGEKGQRWVPGTDLPGVRPERVAVSVFLHRNAYLDLAFRRNPHGSCLLRLSASPEMPSAFVKRREEAAVEVVPLESPALLPLRWHRVELHMDAGRFAARVDGVQVGFWEDATCADGGVGLASGFGLVKVDRLQVSGTERMPEGGDRPFRYGWQNVYRRPWAAACILVGCILAVCTERAFLQLLASRFRGSRWALDRGYGVPVLWTVAGLWMSILPKILFLSLAVLSLVLSRMGSAVSGAAGFLRNRLPRGKGKPVAVLVVLLCLAAASFCSVQGERRAVRVCLSMGRPCGIPR